MRTCPSRYARAFEMGRINGIRQFEELAIEQARDLLKPTPLTGATPLEQLPAGVKAEAAETLLSSTLFVHESARDKGKRKGPGWEKVGKAITDELAATRNKRLKQAVADGNWALARELGNRMIALYGATPERLEEVYSAKLSEAEAVLEQAGERPAELERVHLALHEYEAKSPKPDQARVAKVRARLTELSKKLFERADDLVQTRSRRGRPARHRCEPLRPGKPQSRRAAIDAQSRLFGSRGRLSPAAGADVAGPRPLRKRIPRRRTDVRRPD